MQRFRDVDRKKDRHGIVSVMAMCSDIVMIEPDGRRLGFSSALLVMKHDRNRE